MRWLLRWLPGGRAYLLLRGRRHGGGPLNLTLRPRGLLFTLRGALRWLLHLLLDGRSALLRRGLDGSGPLNLALGRPRSLLLPLRSALPRLLRLRGRRARLLWGRRYGSGTLNVRATRLRHLSSWSG